MIRKEGELIAVEWEEACVNELTPSDDTDPISGFPILKSLRCSVRKI